MLFSSVKKLIISFTFILLLFPLWGQETWDSERLSLEIKMQQRVEEALGKILPIGQFVVVIRVEPLVKIADSKPEAQNQDGFFLPGVPTRIKLGGEDNSVKDLVSTLNADKGFQKFIRRVSATLVLDQDLSDDVVGKVRELTRQILGLDPTRGDTLDIQRTAFQKPQIEKVDNSPISRVQKSLQSYWLVISLSLILFCITVFLLFVFGPLQGFLNRFVQTLATMKPVEGADGKGRYPGIESQILPALMAQSMGLLPPASVGGPSPANFSGSLQVENPNKRVMPFGFIREDHLGNLATLLSREDPEKAAVVLGYLPPDWISRVLSRMEPGFQSRITESLATTRQLLPEQVEDIEQDLKRRLDYLIGGPDRIIAVYESLDAEAQRRMLENLKTNQPDIAEEIRKRTLFFEDLEKFDGSSLKAILREVDLQTLVSAMRGISDSFVSKILESIPAGKAEIVREELELNEGRVGKGTFEAQKKITFIAKRLQREGQIQIPEITPGLPSSRYASSLRSNIKLPPGLNLPSDPNTAKEAEIVKPNSGIEERIKKFMKKSAGDASRYPLNKNNDDDNVKG